MPKLIDLTGKKFNKLLVLERTENIGKKVAWKCQCECGNQPLIKGTSLLHGVKSCGCIKSKGEIRIAQLLTENNIPFETQKTFDNCLLPNTQYHAYFDFWVNNSYLIEYDGIQHFEIKTGGWNNKENLLKTQERDKIKTEWCKNNNIPLIRVPYWKLDTLTIEDLLLNKK